MSKPREFWINDNAEGDGTKNWSKTPWFGYIHVIEYSAYEDLLERYELASSSDNAHRDALEAIRAGTPHQTEELKTIANLQEKNDKLQAQNYLLKSALEKLREGWLYWPSKHQPDPRITMYDSKGLKEIEEMAREALKGSPSKIAAKGDE